VILIEAPSSAYRRGTAGAGSTSTHSRGGDLYDRLLTGLELEIVQTAKAHDAQTFYRLRSIPGVGKILALVLLYEIHNIRRFPRVQDFVSYAGSSSVRQNPPAHAMGPPARRSAMPT